jgi:hypothetical protein
MNDFAWLWSNLRDLKSSGAKAPCGFDPRPRHWKIKRVSADCAKRARVDRTFDSHDSWMGPSHDRNILDAIQLGCGANIAIARFTRS